MHIDTEFKGRGYSIQTAVRQALRRLTFQYGLLGNYLDAERELICTKSWSVSEWHDYWSNWYDRATEDTDFYNGGADVLEHKKKFMAELDDIAVSCGVAIYEDEDENTNERKWVNFDKTSQIARSEKTAMAVYNVEELARYLVKNDAVSSIDKMADDTTVEVEVTVKIQPHESRLVASSMKVHIMSESTGLDSTELLVLR